MLRKLFIQSMILYHINCVHATIPLQIMWSPYLLKWLDVTLCSQTQSWSRFSSTEGLILITKIKAVQGSNIHTQRCNRSSLTKVESLFFPYRSITKRKVQPQNRSVIVKCQIIVLVYLCKQLLTSIYIFLELRFMDFALQMRL